MRIGRVTTVKNEQAKREYGMRSVIERQRRNRVRCPHPVMAPRIMETNRLPTADRPVGGRARAFVPGRQS